MKNYFSSNILVLWLFIGLRPAHCDSLFIVHIAFKMFITCSWYSRSSVKWFSIRWKLSPSRWIDQYSTDECLFTFIRLSFAFSVEPLVQRPVQYHQQRTRNPRDNPIVIEAIRRYYLWNSAEILLIGEIFDKCHHSSAHQCLERVSTRFKEKVIRIGWTIRNSRWYYSHLFLEKPLLYYLPLVLISIVVFLYIYDSVSMFPRVAADHF